MAKQQTVVQETQQELQETPQESGEYELPPGYENVSVGFRRAFEHAKRHGNGDKASLLCAEAWAYHFEEAGEDDV